MCMYQPCLPPWCHHPLAVAQISFSSFNYYYNLGVFLLRTRPVASCIYVNNCLWIRIFFCSAVNSSLVFNQDSPSSKLYSELVQFAQKTCSSLYAVRADKLDNTWLFRGDFSNNVGLLWLMILLISFLLINLWRKHNALHKSRLYIKSNHECFSW
jgi:hypothetical protein